MKDEVKNRLDAIFSKHEEKESKNNDLKERKIQQESAFLKSFLEISESIIRPAFEEIGFSAKAKGLNYRIDKQADITAHDGKHSRAGISICFYSEDDGRRPFFEYPNLSITCNKYQQSVLLYQSTISPKSGGQGGPIGEFKIEVMTVDFIQDKLIDLLHKILT